MAILGLEAARDRVKGLLPGIWRVEELLEAYPDLARRVAEAGTAAIELMLTLYGIRVYLESTAMKSVDVKKITAREGRG